MKSLIFHTISRFRKPQLIFFFLLLKIKKLFRINFEKNKEKHQPKIDIIIPTLSKDFALIDDLVASFAKLNHEINKIFVVAPDKQEIREYCAKKNIMFINERDVLGYGKEIINYKVDGVDRSGWLFQQLLKLSGENIVEMDNYFILDSDTIIADNFSLIENGKFIFYQNEEWNQPYFDAFKKIFGYSTKNKLSFTSHMMIFNKDMLRGMKKELETKHNKSWDKVYISTANPHEASCISDYDTYANWVLCNFPEKVIERPLYNKAFSRKKLEEIKKNMSAYSRKYKTISFHSYLQ